MQIVFSKKSLAYKSPGHPESPERIMTAHERLKNFFTFIEPVEATEEDLLRVHHPQHILSVRNNTFFDFDSPNYDNIYTYAALSAGGAIRAMELQGFSMMRPPGHHAGKNFLGGFCYFNNLAVAIKKSGLKTLIVDFDGHHGNGTEDIFTGDSQVTFISTHRVGIFPGSGYHSKDNIHNYPLERDYDDEEYLEVLEGALDRVADKPFEQLAISAGFDGHQWDPLASLGLSTSAYEKIGILLATLNLPSFAVLEGGYVGKDLGENILAFIRGISNDPSTGKHG